MTISAYQTLYESSVAFGMRKALQSEQGKADMERKVGFNLRGPSFIVTKTTEKSQSLKLRNVKENTKDKQQKSC